MGNGRQRVQQTSKQGQKCSRKIKGRSLASGEVHRALPCWEIYCSLLLIVSFNIHHPSLSIFHLPPIITMATQNRPLPSRFIPQAPTSPPLAPSPAPFPTALHLNTPHDPPDHPQIPKPPRALLSQSLIFPSHLDQPSKAPTMSRLDTMARHISSTALDQPICPAPAESFPREPLFNRSNDPNPFASTAPSVRPFLGFTKQEMGKRISADPFEPVRRRRESVDQEAVYRGGTNGNLKFLQRSQLMGPKVEQRNDCQSASTASGELNRPKNFDFLKRRKEQAAESGSHSGKALPRKAEMPPLCLAPFTPLQLKTPLFMKPHQDQPVWKPKPVQGNLLSGSVQFKKKEMNGQLGKSASSQLLKTREPLVKPQLTVHQFSMGDFEVVSKLGKGAFGEVFAAVERTSGFVCVIKKMSKRRIQELKVEEHVRREIKLQSYLTHSHLTSLYGYFHDHQYLYLILELLPDGSLQQVKKKRKLPEREAAGLVRQAAEGLKYMHDEYVIHRDIKPENLFLNQGYLKIGDFGCSIYHYEPTLRNTLVGCLEYSSPEQLSHEGHSDKIDAWSLGILTFELLYGKSPFENDIKKIVRGGNVECLELSFPVAPAVSEEGKEFMWRLLEKEPAKRMEMDEVLTHPFLKQDQ